jgi:hypothetical protein
VQWVSDADLARLGAEERRALPQTRHPEPHAVMTNPDAVEAFDRQGRELLRPVYLFNDRRVSRLAPRDGIPYGKDEKQ